MTPDLPPELAGADPAEVLAFVRSAGDEELAAAVHRLGTPATLDLLFAAMAGRFAAKPGRRPDRLAFALDDNGTEHVRVLRIDEAGAAVVAAGERPRATLRTTLVRFLKLAAGAADPTRLVLTGRLRLSGDAFWAATTLAGLSAR